MFSRSLVFPYAPLYILSLGGDPSEVGLVYALGPLGGLVMYPIAGYLADHVDRAKLIALTGYVSALVVLIYVVAPNWKWVAFARMLQGIGAVQTPAQSSIIADSLDPSNRGRGNATMTTVAGTVALIAPYIAGVLTILPLMLASYSGGVLYELDSTWPWMIVPGITMAGFLLAAVFVRDPEVAEV